MLIGLHHVPREVWRVPRPFRSPYFDKFKLLA
jgi:hypothetical protein